MKPQHLKVIANPAHSFSVRRDYAPIFENVWHFHKEIELIHFEKGNGTQFVGDNIKKFKSGDLVMIGANLPHFWRFDGGKESTYDIDVIHFDTDVWGETFLNLPENKLIRELIDYSRYGIEIIGEVKKKVIPLIKHLSHAPTVHRLTILIQILSLLADSVEHMQLSSTRFNCGLQSSESKRINDIYKYSFANYKQKIAIVDVASVANISPSSFCKYFRNQTGKTYSQFLIEYRIGLACKLLIEDKLTIQQICYESGFNNFVSFHKHFKKLTNKTPAAYQKEFFFKRKN